MQRTAGTVYNVKIGVSGEYITGLELLSYRSDVKTLKPVLQKLEQFLYTSYEEVVLIPDMKVWRIIFTWISQGKPVSLSPATMTERAAKCLRNRLAVSIIWSTTQRKIFLSVHKDAVYHCGGNARKSRTDNWFPICGIVAKAAMGVLAASSAAVIKINPKRS